MCCISKPNCAHSSLLWKISYRELDYHVGTYDRVSLIQELEAEDDHWQHHTKDNTRSWPLIPQWALTKEKGSRMMCILKYNLNHPNSRGRHRQRVATHCFARTHKDLVLAIQCRRSNQQTGILHSQRCEMPIFYTEQNQQPGAPCTVSVSCQHSTL